jgi:aryl-alcohol dehydrogenase-like predicted oxidoreductase
MMKITRREFNKTALAAGTLLTTAGPAAFAGPAGVIKRAIPSTGEMLPIIGLGTNRYGVGDDADKRATLQETLARFHEWGGTLIDTAPSYRTSEIVLGDLMAKLGIRGDMFLATKVDQPRPSLVDDQMRSSQGKLQTQVFELMQVHNVRYSQMSLPVLREWRDRGLVKYIGITTSRSSQYEELEAIMKAEDMDFVQLNYSLEQRESAERLLPLAADRGMAVIINRAFGGGRIFEAVGDTPLPAWAKELGITSWAQFLLKYALSHPAATVAIPGMTKARHVDDNFGAAHGPMPDSDQRKQMEAFFDAL